jgi:hypothetical protein
VRAALQTHTSPGRGARRAGRLASLGALVASIAVVASGALGACGGDDSNSSTTTTTASLKNFTVTLPSGQASLSLTGELPPNWPSGFPLPPDTTAAGSGSVGGSSTTQNVAVFKSSRPPKEVYDFYVNNDALHVSDQSAGGVGSTYAGQLKFSGDFQGSLAVVGRGNTTYLVVQLESAGAATTTTT